VCRAEHALALISILALGACTDGEPVVPTDAGADTVESDGRTPFIPTPPAAVAPPILTPCPEGWREIVGPDFAECDPWPAAGRASCGADEAHFPGEPTCRRIGPACPADGVPTDLPPDAIHVREGATAGDGSDGAPFGTLAEALAVAGPDAVIGLAVGSYSEVTIMRDASVTIVGACTSTIIDPGSGTAFTVLEGSLALRNLRVKNAFGGLLARNAVIDLESLIFEDISDTPVATNAASTVDGRDLLVRRAGGGAFFFPGSTATLSEIVVEDSGGFALGSSSGSLTASVVAVTGVLDGTASGFVSAVSSTVVLEQVFFASDPLAPIFATGSDIRITDAVLFAPPGADTRADQVGFLGTGEAAITLERVTVTRAGGLVVGIAGIDASATLTDVVVREVLDDGHAIEVGDGARAELRRTFIDRAGRNGMLFFGAGTEVIASDIHIRASQPDLIGFWGRGIGVQTAATLSAERVLLESHHEIGLVVASEGTQASFFDLEIRDTRERACVDTGCPAAGIGMGTYAGGAARVERFEIADNAFLGVQLADEGEIELVDGIVSGHPVGANIQNPEFDVTLLTDRVDYRDNGANLDSSELYVPAPTTP